MILKGEEGKTQDSAPCRVDLPARPQAPKGVTAQDASLQGRFDGKLLNVDPYMEYRTAGGDWTKIAGPTVEGLAPGTYEVRYRATDSSFISPSVFLTVEEGPLPNAKTPEAALDFENEVLTGLTPGGSYEINGNDYTADENGRIPLEESWLGGDIVIIQTPDAISHPLVKRVIATGGQTVRIDFDTWEIFVDEKLVKEDYIRKTDEPMKRYEISNYFNKIDAERKIFEEVVPENCVFVLGDNRNNSTDSRDNDVGFIREEYLLGKALFRVAPFGKFKIG